MKSSYLAERQTVPITLDGISVFKNGQLLPSHPDAADHLVLSDAENSAMKTALRSTIGPERSRDNRHFKGDVHVVSYAAALRPGPDNTQAVSAMFDAERGRGVLTDGEDSALAARTVAHGFLRAMARNKPEQLITSYDASEAVRLASSKANLAIYRARSHLDETQEDSSASLSGFQFLYKGRMAVSHSGDTAVMVYGPDGLCKRLTQANNHRLGGAGAEKNGHNTVVDLKPGRNVVILANESVVAGMHSMEMEELISSPGLSPDDPDGAAAIAERIMTDRAPISGGGVMAVIVDVDEPIDKRSRFRKSLDPLRASTYIFGLMAGIKKPGIGRRALYDEPTKRGESWRRLSRTVDLTTAAVGALAAYNLTRRLEIDWDFITDNNLFDGLADNLGSGSPDAPANGADTQPQAMVPEITPPGETPETSQFVDDYPDERRAESNDSSSGRASNVSDWSAQAIEYYGQKEGLSSSDISALTTDWDTIAKVNDGLYTDNQDVAAHPLNYLMDDGVYDTSSQNDTAHQVVLDWKAAHTPTTFVPPETPSPTTPTIDSSAQILEQTQSDTMTEPNTGANNRNDQIAPVLAAIIAAGVAAGATGAVAHRHKERRLTEIAEREKNGQARSHNRKYRRLLDNQSSNQNRTPRPRQPQESVMAS